MSQDIIELKVPDIGRSNEIKLVCWYKAEGDILEVGDEVCDLSSDKAQFALEVPVRSRLDKILVTNDSIVEINDVIGLLTVYNSPPATNL